MSDNEANKQGNVPFIAAAAVITIVASVFAAVVLGGILLLVQADKRTVNNKSVNMRRINEARDEAARAKSLPEQQQALAAVSNANTGDTDEQRSANSVPDSDGGEVDVDTNRDNGNSETGQGASSSQASRNTQSVGSALNTPPRTQKAPIQSNSVNTSRANSKGGESGKPPADTSSSADNGKTFIDGHIDGYTQTVQMLDEYIEQSDAAALRRLQEDVGGSAAALYEYAGESAAKGIGSRVVEGVTELSSAYGILAENIDYAAAALENGEAYDAELITLTKESADEKFNSAEELLE